MATVTQLNLSLGALTALQLIATMVFQLVVVALEGAGPSTDAYIASQAVPMVLFSILSVSLQSVWQPQLVVVAKDAVAWKSMQRSVQGQAVLAFGISALVLGLTAELWIHALFPGFDSRQIGIAVSMLHWQLVAVFCNGQISLYQTALRARSRFLGSEAIVLVSTLLMVAALPQVLPSAGIESVAWLTAARAAVVMLVLHVLSGRPMPSLRAAVRRRDVFTSALPLLGGSSLYKTSPLVDRYWSSQATAGGLTVFSFAQMGMGAAATVFERAFSMPAGPRLAQFIAAGDWLSARSLYRGSLRNLTVVSLIAAVALFVLYPVWPFVVRRLLNIDAPLAREMWVICVFLVGYLYVAAAGTLVVAAFYAMGDTRTPVVVSIIGFATGVLLKSGGFVLFGLSGLALATSLYYMLNMSVLYVLLERRIRGRLSI